MTFWRKMGWLWSGWRLAGRVVELVMLVATATALGFTEWWQLPALMGIAIVANATGWLEGREELRLEQEAKLMTELQKQPHPFRQFPSTIREK